MNVFGKENGFPAFGGLSFEIVEKKLMELFSILQVNCQVEQSSPSLKLDVPLRLPTFCPGCPHRETLSLLKDLRKVIRFMTHKKEES